MLSLQPLPLAAAALLLLAATSTSAQTIDFGLEEPGCAPVSADTLSAFATNAGEWGPVRAWSRCFWARGALGGRAPRRDTRSAPASPHPIDAPPCLSSIACCLTPMPLLPAPRPCADGNTSVTRAQAADIACHLKPLLDRAAANDAAADATLTAVYQAWRQAFRPQVGAWDVREEE